MTNKRTPCAMPFCKRGTTKLEPGYEFLCANHWPLVPRKLKALRTKHRRRYAKALASSLSDLELRQSRHPIADDEYQATYRKHLSLIKRHNTFERRIWKKMKAALMP